MTNDTREAFQQYRRKQIAELRPWQDGDLMTGISVSAEDAKAGSPKPGDMIARNPKNHADQWLVAEAYFADNFEPLTASPGEQKPVAWIDFADKGGIRLWTSEQRRADAEMALGRKMTPVYTSPPPAAGWDIEAVERVQSAYDELCVRFSGVHSDDATDSVLLRLHAALKALRREAPASSGEVEDDLDAKIAALAHRFWSIHPSTIAAKNLTREQFYAQEMTKLIKAVRG